MPLNSICVGRNANGFRASKLCSEKTPPADLPAGFADRDRMRTNPDFLDGIARQLMSACLARLLFRGGDGKLILQVRRSPRVFFLCWRLGIKIISQAVESKFKPSSIIYRGEFFELASGQGKVR